MGSVARVRGLVASLMLGAGSLGCGQVTSSTGGEGASANDSPGGESGTVNDRFALATSGERVLALGYLSEGVAQFRTLHDRVLDFDCEFVEGVADADLHCVPKRTATLIFLDEACSQPATWILDPSLHAGDWVSVGSPYRNASEGIPSHRDVFVVAEQVSPEYDLSHESQVYELQGTACVHAVPPAKSLPAVNRLIAHADTEFAPAKLLNLDAGGGFWLSRLMGADGAEFTAAVTSADGGACSVQPTDEIEPMHCATMPVPTTQRVQLGSGAVHVEQIMSSPSDGRAGLPVGQYPAVTDFLDNGGELCRPTKAVDGTLRCARVVLGAYESDRWADAACTERLYYSDWPAGADVSRLRAPVLASDGSLAAVATVTAYTGPVYAIDSGGCVSRPSGDTLVQLDQLVDISTMPEVFETAL